jgi:phosphatidylglycerophosphate synthase
MTTDHLSPKQRFEKESRPYGYYILRPLGRLCLPLALKIGATPNQVTLATLPIILVAMALFAAGGFVLSIAAVLTLHVGLVLDHLDGDLARATGKTSVRGEFLDALIGYIYGALLPAAVGFGVSRVPDLGHDTISDIIDIPADAYIQIGLWAGLAFVTSRLISLRYRTLFSQSLREGAAGFGRASMIFSSSLPLIIFAGAVTQYLSFVLIVYTVFYALTLIYIIVGSYVRSASEPGG